MYNPTTRLLSILELLQSRGQISAQELAQRLEVEERSVRRYIMMLRDMGIPIESERGRYGGYTMRPGFRLPPMMFNHDEIVAVMVGLMFAEDSGAFPALAIESARAKIERVLPDELRQKSLALQETLSLETSHFHPVDGAILLALSLAVIDEQALTMHYMNAGGTISERDISPYGVVMHGQAFYLAAYCHLRGEMRTFRLERIQALRESDAEYVIHISDFDARSYVLNSLATLPGLEAFEVLIHLPRATVAEHIPASMAMLEEVNGETLMRCYSDDAFWMARFLAGLEMRFTVLATDSLRDALRTLAERLIRSTK